MSDTQRLQNAAREIRRDTLRAIHAAGSGHPGGCLSAADLFAVLYFHTLRVNPRKEKDPGRDRFVLSKGHAAPGLYAALMQRGFFSREELMRIRRMDGELGATTNPKNPGCDMSSGSLGQGLSTGVGMALAGKLDNMDYRVFVMVGDGELQEGQNWEAIMMAPHYKLDNLYCIVDNNHIQMCADTNATLPVGNIGAKFREFGWRVSEVDGNDIPALVQVFDEMAANPAGAPTAIIADTVKGKGVSFMEGTCNWHGGTITDEQLTKALGELEGCPV